MLLTYPEGAALEEATWVDLFGPTEDEVQSVKKATGLRVPTEAQISEIESTSRLAFDQGAYYVSTPLMARSEHDDHRLVAVGFVLSKSVLLTVRFAHVHSIDEAHHLCKTQPTRSGEEAFLHILEAVVDRAADKLEHARADCDELSRMAFRRSPPTRVSNDLQWTLRRIGTVADQTSLVRDGLLGIGRIGAYIMGNAFEDAPQVSEARLQGVRADVTSLTDYEAHLSGKVQFLLDATLGFINIEQNEIVKTLTIASVVGIPPVLVVGVYGMNFRNMPELGWRLGYPFALVLIAVSAAIPLVWFKWRRWM
jgi:magnesium transporter